MNTTWHDAQTDWPPEESLILVIEYADSNGRVADMVTGFFADGEYFTGTTMAGDPLSADQLVRYWALPAWPECYDADGIWRGTVPNAERTGRGVENED